MTWKRIFNRFKYELFRDEQRKVEILRILFFEYIERYFSSKGKKGFIFENKQIELENIHTSNV